MLLAATAIFLYYTAWTLLMVCIPELVTFQSLLTRMIAFRRPGPPSPRHLSSTCLGHSHPRYPGPPRLRCGGHLHRHCDDQQQQEEGRQGQGCGEKEDLKGDQEKIQRDYWPLGPVSPLVHTQRKSNHRGSSHIIGKIIKLNQVRVSDPVPVPVPVPVLRTGLTPCSNYALGRSLGK